MDKSMGRFIFFFWGRGKDVGRIQIKGSQIRREFGKLHFSSLILLVILPLYLFFKDQFVGEINLFVQTSCLFPNVFIVFSISVMTSKNLERLLLIKSKYSSQTFLLKKSLSSRS